MKKLTDIVKKVLNILFDPRYEKIVIVALPTIAIMLSLMIISPTIIDIIHLARVDSMNESVENNLRQSSASSRQESEIRPTSSPAPTPTPSAEILSTASTPALLSSSTKDVHLTYTSIQNNLYIFVRDSSGYPVQGDVFQLNITYPDGQTKTASTSTDGSLFLENISAGQYTVQMQSKDGYTQPGSISCSVSNAITYEKIEEIEDIVEIKDAAEISDEIKISGNEAPIEVIPETIITIDEPVAVQSDNTTSVLLDSNGYETYTYSYETINGHLILSDGTESDVVPIEEDGQLVFGLVLDSENSTSYTIDLFNPDNTPVSDYLISYESVGAESNENNIVTGWQNINGNVYYVESDGSYATGLKSIDGSIYYFDYTGRKASSVGIDVSFYNGTINWQTVKNSGIDFAILRVGGRGWSTGALYDDSCFYNYLIGAKAAGLKVGVYFYSTAVNPVEAIQEASLVLDRLNNVTLDFPIFIDMEYSGDYPAGRSDTLSMAERVVVALTFCKTVNNSGYQAGIYSSQSFITDCLDYNSISPYCIWLANYTENNQLPNFAGRYDIWQFTDRGHVPGVNGSCDLNVIF